MIPRLDRPRLAALGAAALTMAVGVFALARGLATDDPLVLPAPASVPAAGSEAPTESTPNGSAPAGSAVEIDIVDFAFSPAELTITAGTEVTWTNSDSVDHTVTDNGAAFSSPLLGTGDTFTFTFTEPGTYNYICSLHPNMTATITVEA